MSHAKPEASASPKVSESVDFSAGLKFPPALLFVNAELVFWAMIGHFSVLEKPAFFQQDLLPPSVHGLHTTQSPLAHMEEARKCTLQVYDG